MHAQSAISASSFQIKTEDVDALAALALIARGMNINLIIGPSLEKQRISFSGTFRSSDEFLEMAAAKMGAQLTRRGNVNIIHSTCIPHTSLTMPTMEDRRLSLYFQREKLQTLLGFFRTPIPQRGGVEELGRRTIAVTIKNLTYREAFEAIAYSAGVDVTNSETQSRDLDQKLSIKKCAAPIIREEEIPTSPMRRTNNCPYRAQNNNSRTCDPLEVFSLHTLLPLGFIHINNANYALIESPDSILNTIHIGDRIGKNRGKVLAISPGGIDIQEFVADKNNHYKEIISTLKFGVYPLPRPDALSDNVEKDSPLYRYTNSLGTLFATTRTPAHIETICAELSPQSRGAISTAISSWHTQNAKELEEIAIHVEAYLDRKAKNFMTPKATFREEYENEVSAGIFDMVKKLGGAQNPKMFAYCNNYPSTLLRDNIKIQYNAELDVIRLCEASASCPDTRDRAQ